MNEPCKLVSTTTYSTASSTRPDDLTFSSGRTKRRRTKTGTASGRTAPYVALFLEVRIEVSPRSGPKLSSERHRNILCAFWKIFFERELNKEKKLGPSNRSQYSTHISLHLVH